MPPKPNETWMFRLVGDHSVGTISALGVSVAKRSVAAALQIEMILSQSDVTATIEPLGSLAESPLDSAARLAAELDNGQAAVSAFAYDRAEAFDLPLTAPSISPAGEVERLRATVLGGEIDGVTSVGNIRFQRGFYVLLDAARILGLPEILAGSGLAHACLFDGKAAVDYADAAPYLVHLRADHRLTAQLLDPEEPGPLGWQAEIGVFLVSPLSLRGLRGHLRKFTMVQDAERGRRLYFRFHDPRVFRSVFVSAPEETTRRFMRAIDFAAFPGRDGDVLRYSVS